MPAGEPDEHVFEAGLSRSQVQQFGALLGGAVLTETVFGWPGMGQLLVESIFARDYPMVQGIVLVFSALFILTNFLVDLSYVLIDPRIHYD